MALAVITLVLLALFEPSRAAAQIADSAATAGVPQTTTNSCEESIELRSSMLSDTRRALWRALSVTAATSQSGLFRSSSLGSPGCIDRARWLRAWSVRPAHARFEIFPLEAAVQVNDEYPRSVNDGAAWRGVGANFAASIGAHFQWRAVTANIAPEVFYNSNEGFAFAPNVRADRSRFANAFHQGIDYPTRLGSDAVGSVSPGQSYISALLGPVTLTVGTENLWIGSADTYPILLSYTAPGFPHLRVSPGKPLDLRIADLEAHFIYGSLRESEHFDTLSANDRHFFATTLAIIKPHIVPGLSLGVARAYHDSARFRAQPLYIPFSGLSNERAANVIDVVLARWVLPNSGFEIYGEWSRERAAGFTDLVRNAEHTQAYVAGFQKVVLRTARLIRLYGELIHLGESSASRAGGEFASYYTDGRVNQGHTHRGQLLGAGIGPGSDAQLLGVDVFSEKSRTEFRLERTRYDDDTYYRVFARRFGETGHDAEVTVAASRTQMVDKFELEVGAAFSHRHNPYFTLGPDELRNNFTVSLRASWRDW